MIKQCFLDLETTGDDFMKHGVYQIGGVIRFDRTVMEEFEFNCNIYAQDEINPAAFEHTKVKPEDLANYPDPLETYQKFVEILGKHVNKFEPKDKFFFLNFGAEFDSKFLRRWFESIGDQYFGSWFWHPPIEVQSFAAEFLKTSRINMENFKLKTVAKWLDIPTNEDFLHTALYDARLAMKVYDKVVMSFVIDRVNAKTQEITDSGVYMLHGERKRRF